jgi:hypothetical protein
MRRSLVALTCAALALVAAEPGDGHSRSGRVAVKATSSPQGDALFHRDPRRLGSDGAYSVPLRDGRILWLFGDTFIATTPRHVRSEAAFVRNTIAIERGSNPTRASMRFFWGRDGSRPASFFPEQGRRWFWPQHGIRLHRGLLVFLDRIRENPRGSPGFNFEGDGWRLAVITNASASPAQWRVRTVTPPRALDRFDAGKAVNLIGRYVVSLAIPERGGPPFPGYLLRWRADDLAAGRLGRAQWWAGQRGWVAASSRRDPPTAIVPDVGPRMLAHIRSLPRPLDPRPQ